MKRIQSLMLTALAVFTLSAPALAGPDISVGVLRCNAEGTISFIFGSTRDVSCVFDPAGDGANESYKGSIKNFGIDIGYTEAGVLVWGVLAASADVDPGALNGTYGGVSADIAAGYGVGVNALILGGPNNAPSLALQPLSIEGNEGLNIAAGISSLELKAVQ